MPIAYKQQNMGNANNGDGKNQMINEELDINENNE